MLCFVEQSSCQSLDDYQIFLRRLNERLLSVLPDEIKESLNYQTYQRIEKNFNRTNYLANPDESLPPFSQGFEAAYFLTQAVYEYCVSSSSYTLGKNGFDFLAQIYFDNNHQIWGASAEAQNFCKSFCCYLKLFLFRLHKNPNLKMLEDQESFIQKRREINTKIFNYMRDVLDFPSAEFSDDRLAEFLTQKTSRTTEFASSATEEICELYCNYVGNPVYSDQSFGDLILSWLEEKNLSQSEINSLYLAIVAAMLPLSRYDPFDLYWIQQNVEYLMRNFSWDHHEKN
jgi:hypothetical protein